MSDKPVQAVTELRVHTLNQSVRTLLDQWLEAHGIKDYIEASCDFLDAEPGEMEDVLAAFEAGELDLPLVFYSYDPFWLASLEASLQVAFPDSLRFERIDISNALWQEPWEPGFRFLETERFLIGPEDFMPPSNAKHRICLRSGAIFGSGQHATTQALLRLFEAEAGSNSQKSFLDVGTGTGVLCLAAYHLGYRRLVGTDIEPEALSVARSNQELNQIHFELVEGSFPRVFECFDTVVCNILPPTLTGLISDLIKHLKPDGVLYLAGINEVNAKPTIERLRPLGMEEVGAYDERGWLARRYVRVR